MTFPFKVLTLAVLAAGGAVASAAAQVPDSDIWAADIIPAGGGNPLRLGDPVNMTHRPGYDNQPAFLYQADSFGEGRHAVSHQRFAHPLPGILYTSADSLGATDIFRWDPYTKTSIRVTHTPESEYSPTPFGIDAKTGGPAAFDVVRVEADSTQRLWRFDMDGSNPRLVMSDVDSVGYFAWMDENHVAMFVLGNEKKKQPHTLRVVDVRAPRETIVARDIGRCIQRYPWSSDVMFTARQDDDSYRFLVLRRGRDSGEPLINALTGGQDACWYLPDVLLMSSGSTIYSAHPEAKVPGERDWRPVRNFAGDGIGTITRIAVSQDRGQIAFVATAAAP